MLASAAWPKWFWLDLRADLWGTSTRGDYLHSCCARVTAAWRRSRPPGEGPLRATKAVNKRSPVVSHHNHPVINKVLLKTLNVTFQEMGAKEKRKI